jgi:hypothetical protein
MGNVPKIKKELTLIESIVEHSKEIIGIKATILAYKQGLNCSSYLRYRPIDLSAVRTLIKEYELRLEEMLMQTGNLMKARYSKDMIVLGDTWHLSKTDMAAGFAWIKKNNDPNYILFLTDNVDPFLDTIKAGEIHPYQEVKDRLKNCTPAWKSSSIRELYLQKYKEIEDDKK